jgi:hypothetical protein
MSSVANTGLTADIWSTTHNIWIGIIAHWLDENTIIVKSAALSCKRIKCVFCTTKTYYLVLLNSIKIYE